jgi:chemotaxis protein CheY-P-specific phosphatase CheC
MNLNHSKSLTKSNFTHLLHGHLPTEVNIYSEAVLKRKAPLMAFSKVSEVNEKELTILFQLNGEMQGQILCTIDLTQKKFNDSHIMILQSLFTESMNILLGQFLTDLEQDTEIMSMISHPEIILREKKNKLLEDLIENYSYNLSTKYELFTIKDSYQCSIYILANKKTTKEV